MTSYDTLKIVPWAQLLVRLPQAPTVSACTAGNEEKTGPKVKLQKESLSPTQSQVAHKMVTGVYLLCWFWSTNNEFSVSLWSRMTQLLTDFRRVSLSPFCFGRKCLCCIYRSSLCPCPSKFSEDQVSSDAFIRAKNPLILSLFRHEQWQAPPQLVLGTWLMPRRQVLPNVYLGWKSCEGKNMTKSSLVWAWIPYNKSFHVFWPWRFPSRGGWKMGGELLSDSAYPNKAFPAGSTVGETGLCSFLLFSRTSDFFHSEPCFLYSEDTLALSVLGRNWTVRKPIRKLAETRDVKMSTSSMRFPSLAVTAICSISLCISVCKMSHFRSAQTYFTLLFLLVVSIL